MGNTLTLMAFALIFGVGFVYFQARNEDHHNPNKGAIRAAACVAFLVINSIIALLSLYGQADYTLFYVIDGCVLAAVTLITYLEKKKPLTFQKIQFWK